MAIDEAAKERVNAILRDMAPLEEEPTWSDARRAIEAMADKIPLADDMQVEFVSADGVPCLWVSAPGTSSERAILMLHGGGYLLGSAMGYRDLAYRFSKAADARVLVVDYRLAPDHAFPAGTEDGRTAYRWLCSQYPVDKISIVGDSAGGGMAVSVCVQTRDDEGPLPPSLVLISPFVDLAAEGESSVANVDRDVYILKDVIVGNAQVYLEGRDPKQTPLGSPLYYEDLSGLPPMIISAGADEMLLSDSTRLAEKVEAAGGDAELHVVDDMQHIFPYWACLLPEAREMVERMGNFIKARWE